MWCYCSSSCLRVVLLLLQLSLCGATAPPATQSGGFPVEAACATPTSRRLTFCPSKTSVSCTTDVAPIPSELSATLMGCSLSTELMAVMAHAFLPGAVALTGLPHTECEG